MSECGACGRIVTDEGPVMEGAQTGTITHASE